MARPLRGLLRPRWSTGSLIVGDEAQFENGFNGKDCTKPLVSRGRQAPLSRRQDEEVAHLRTPNFGG